MIRVHYVFLRKHIQIYFYFLIDSECVAFSLKRCKLDNRMHDFDRFMNMFRFSEHILTTIWSKGNEWNELVLLSWGRAEASSSRATAWLHFGGHSVGIIFINSCILGCLKAWKLRWKDIFPTFFIIYCSLNPNVNMKNYV